MADSGTVKNSYCTSQLQASGGPLRCMKIVASIS